MNDKTEPQPPYTGAAAVPFVVDLVWVNGRLWLCVDGCPRIRRYEITGGGAGHIVWKGNAE